LAKEMINVAFEVSLFILQSDFLYAIKSYNMGPDSFTSPSKEGMLQSFIDHKNPSHQPGLNLRTIGPMVSMITTILLRQLDQHYYTAPYPRRTSSSYSPL
jgi:hypothetical protein